MNERYYDCHSHVIEEQAGGFLIALEGEPSFDFLYNNQEVLTIIKEGSEIIPVQYVSKALPADITTEIIKYHPRREKYDAKTVDADIRRRRPKAVILDSLNQPFWKPADYETIAGNHPEVLFIFPHGGGFDILEFIRMCMFHKNIWLDFSFTQHYFGWCGKETAMPHVCQMIDYAFHDPRVCRRVMFGSDSKFYSAGQALEKYKNYSAYEDLIIHNYHRFLDAAGL